MRKLIALGAASLVALTGACAGDDAPEATATKATTTTVEALKGTLPAQGQLEEVIKISGTKATRGELPKSGISTADPAVRTQNVRTMEDYMNAIINDVNAYWRAVFTQSGIGQYFRAPQYNWYQDGTSPANACNVNTEIGPYYCTLDFTIYFSPQQAYEMWAGTWDATGRRSPRPGDFAVAGIIAHEFGHHVQNLLQVKLDNPLFELQADCLIGGWANSAYYAGILEAGDIEEGIAMQQTIGDFAYGSPQHHGTPDQRVQAFLLGYNNAVGSCFR